LVIPLGRTRRELVRAPVRIGVVVLVIRHHRIEHGARLLRRRRRVEVVQVRILCEKGEVLSIDEPGCHPERSEGSALGHPHAPSSMSAGPSPSVETVFPSPCSAECSVCHARLAHFTRSGNFDTPPKARSEPSSFACASSSLPVTRSWNFPN